MAAPYIVLMTWLASSRAALSPPALSPPALSLWDGAHLARARAQLADGTASAALVAAVEKLNETAYQSLPEYDPSARPAFYSVMNKSATAPSGDKHGERPESNPALPLLPSS